MKNTEKFPLIIGILLPILMIGFVAGAIYLPKFFVDGPKYDFVYTDTYSYDFYNYYEVIDGKLTKTYEKPEYSVPSSTSIDPVTGLPYNYDYYKNYYKTTKFYLHDFETNESEEVKYNEVREYNLDDDIESPDGFTIERGSGGGLFYPGNYDKVYIKGHGVSQELDMHRTDPYYTEFTFVGWVIPEEEK